MLVFTEATPNPNALKLVPQARLTDGERQRFRRDDWSRSPLAARLFEVEGLEEVFVAEDFVTVTRSADAEAWPTLRIRAIAALADYLDEAGPAPVRPSAEAAPASGLEARIREVLERRVRPYVASHGGDISIARFDAGTGELWVRLLGACGGCPSARLTLKAGVEKLVREEVPEVVRVEEEPGEAAPTPALRSTAKVRPLFTYRGREVARPRG